MDYDLQNPLRIGILGTSWIAPHAVIKPSINLEEVEVFSVASRDPDKARLFATKHGIPNTHESYEDLVKDPLVDCVYISLPNALHCEWAIRSLDAGKHVLCEKPMASNADECRQMKAAAERNNKLLFEGFHYMYHPMWKHIMDEMEKEVDEVKSVEVEYRIPVFRGSDIRYNYQLGGGALMDTGSMAVSAMRMLLRGEDPGEIVESKATLAYPNVDQAAGAKFVSDTGAESTIKCSIFRLIPDITLEVKGKNGARIYASNWSVPHMVYNKVNVYSADGEKKSTSFGRNVSTYQHQLKAFCHAVNTGDYDVPTNVDSAIVNQSIIDRLYMSVNLPLRGLDIPAASEENGEETS